jgi:hypothetical protein
VKIVPSPHFGNQGAFGFLDLLVRKTCQGDWEVETSDQAAILSMGNIELNVGEGTNTASTIYAKGNITITGKGI